MKKCVMCGRKTQRLVNVNEPNNAPYLEPLCSEECEERYYEELAKSISEDMRKEEEFLRG